METGLLVAFMLAGFVLAIPNTVMAIQAWRNGEERELVVFLAPLAIHGWILATACILGLFGVIA